MAAFVFHTRVYTDDTDYGGIVYHSNYLKFMEHARTEWLEAINLPLAKLANEGYLFIIRSAELQYLQPARLNDYLEISCQIEEQNRTQVVFYQEVRKHDDNDCVFATGKIKLVCVNLQLKPTRIPTDLSTKILENMHHGSGT